MDELLGKRFLVVTGKGGVGKSSLAAALALVARRQGLRVLLCEVGHQDRLAPLLGAEPADGPTPRAVDGLHLLRVTPADALHEYGLIKLRYEWLYQAVFESAFVKAFLRLVPSLSETVVLGKLWYEVLAEEDGHPRWDLVILDAPASGHAVSFLRVPRTLLETVPAGPMRDDALRMQATLTDASLTSVQLVSLPEELAVSETLELAAQLTQLELPLGRLFLNAHVPRRLTPAQVATLESLPADADALAQAAAQAGLLSARRADRCARYAEQLASRLPQLPLTEVPFLGAPAWGRPQLEQLADALAGELGP